MPKWLDRQLTPNFRLSEFYKPHHSPTPGMIAHTTALAKKLQLLRAACGNQPITVTSGYRSPAENRAVGGAPMSYHMTGQAADIVVRGLTPLQVSQKARGLFGGVGLYAGHVHVDTGPIEFWQG